MWLRSKAVKRSSLVLRVTEVYTDFKRVKRPQRLSPMGAIMEAIMEGLAENRVLVVDSPGSLQHRVQQTVSSRAIPQSIETAVQARPQLHRPVDDRRLFLQLYPWRETFHECIISASLRPHSLMNVSCHLLPLCKRAWDDYIDILTQNCFSE